MSVRLIPSEIDRNSQRERFIFLRCYVNAVEVIVVQIRYKLEHGRCKEILKILA
jgi:hypothetical protein